jgi:hypothetical protein
VTITVTSTGPCAVYVDFGDKQKAARLSLPSTVKHVYAGAGKYVIRTFTYTSGSEAPGLSRCGGFADMELVVNPKPAVRALAPGGKIAPIAAPPSGSLKVANPAPSGGGAAAEPSEAARTFGGKVTPTRTPTPQKAVR